MTKPTKKRVKTQNILRDGDIDQIIETYKKRITQDKYSYLAPLAEIKENDYNLNIPRYVDTSSAEEIIDLATVAQQIKELDNQMQDTDAKIADFCKQLNIPTPF